MTPASPPCLRTSWTTTLTQHPPVHPRPICAHRCSPGEHTHLIPLPFLLPALPFVVPCLGSEHVAGVDLAHPETPTPACSTRRARARARHLPVLSSAAPLHPGAPPPWLVASVSSNRPPRPV